MTSPWISRVHTRDLEQHARLQGAWSLRYEQLSGGVFDGHILQVQLPGLTLLREDTSVSVRQCGQLDPGSYGFATALEARDDVFFNGQRVPQHAIMCGKGDEVDMLTPSNFTLIAVVVERSLLNPLWERMYNKPLATWLEQQWVLCTTAGKAQALRQAHLTVLDQASALAHRPHDDLALRQFRDEILMEWIEALPARVDTSQWDTVQRRRRWVNQACELMLAHTEAPLSILDICTQLGISRRKLNYCFADVLGTSPMQYLRTLRLNGVHRALTQAPQGSTVQDIAAHWGFWHLSQFAQDYKKRFGQLPSETLRAHTGRRPGADPAAPKQDAPTP